MARIGKRSLKVNENCARNKIIHGLDDHITQILTQREKERSSEGCATDAYKLPTVKKAAQTHY